MRDSLERELKENSYPGRGIVIGRSEDGKNAVAAYFIMGRSVNSRNRIFVEDGEGIRTQAFDPSKLSDPSLIIYAPVRVMGNKTIVKILRNADQLPIDLGTQRRIFPLQDTPPMRKSAPGSRRQRLFQRQVTPPCARGHLVPSGMRLNVAVWPHLPAWEHHSTDCPAGHFQGFQLRQQPI